jgi:hypothetical protein
MLAYAKIFTASAATSLSLAGVVIVGALGQTIRTTAACRRHVPVSATAVAADTGSPREIAEPLVLMIATFTPHIAEELWARLGHVESLDQRGDRGVEESEPAPTTDLQTAPKRIRCERAGWSCADSQTGGLRRLRWDGAPN